MPQLHNQIAPTTPPSTDQWLSGWSQRTVTVTIGLLVALRLAAALAIGFGPWTDEPGELAGWDAERFVTIATSSDRPWDGIEVEYPPGSVLVFDAIALIAGPDPSVVVFNRTLVILGLTAELTALFLLHRRRGSRSAALYLIIGLPLVPMGYLRLDLLTATIALIALIALSPEPGRIRAYRGDGSAGVGWDVVHGVAVAVGAAIKIWPALMIASALALQRLRAMAMAAGFGAVAVAAWLLWVGNGLHPVNQVLAFRGATGWHVESLIGSVVALFGDEPARLELNAFRIGTLRPILVTGGRVAALAAMAWLVVVGTRAGEGLAGEGRDDEIDRPGRSDQVSVGIDELGVAALVAVGSVAALLVSSPLLSPQFLLWLVPLVALCSPTPGARRLVWVVGATTTLTGMTLALFGPARLAETIPAAALTIRNLLLVLVVAGSGLVLGRDRTLSE